ncbi:hypothetical protein [uncultured Mediterranean phage uvMED]|nr:hypothetical protein [uncultured Mediterranean phage uvMED]
MNKKPHSTFKLQKLKELRQKQLEKNLLDVHLKGYDHYVFIDERKKANLVAKDGLWIVEHIRTAILKYNYEIDKIPKLLIKDFSDQEIVTYEKIYANS